jgi:serine/threonine protein kinase
VLLPKSTLRKKFPSAGFTPTSATRYPTTALSEPGFDLLSGLLTPDPAQRATAAAALRHPWFESAPHPTPLSRSEIRQLRRTREVAISSGAHHQAIAIQQAQASIRAAADNAAAIAAAIKERAGY